MLWVMEFTRRNGDHRRTYLWCSHFSRVVHCHPVIEISRCVSVVRAAASNLAPVVHSRATSSAPVDRLESSHCLAVSVLSWFCSAYVIVHLSEVLLALRVSAHSVQSRERDTCLIKVSTICKFIYKHIQLRIHNITLKNIQKNY